MRNLWIVIIVLFTMSLPGCRNVAMDTIKGAPADHSGFIENPEHMTNDDTLPLDSFWVSDILKNDYEKYTKIVVRPVNTAYVLRTSDWTNINLKTENEVKRDVENIAKHIEKSLKEVFTSGRVPQLTLVESAGPNTIVMEVALTELIPTDVVRNVAGQVAGFMIPGGGLVSTGSGGRISEETRLVDGVTGEVLFKSKAHRTDKITVVNLAGLTPYRHVKNNIKDLINETVEILNTPYGEKIEGASFFTLSPW